MAAGLARGGRHEKRWFVKSGYYGSGDCQERLIRVSIRGFSSHQLFNKVTVASAFVLSITNSRSQYSVSVHTGVGSSEQQLPAIMPE